MRVAPRGAGSLSVIGDRRCADDGVGVGGHAGGIDLAQLQLGRFEDALSTFKQADSFGTPQVSRWTWKLGAGWTYLMMGRSADALP
jgi:hypothetical protein